MPLEYVIMLYDYGVRCQVLIRHASEELNILSLAYKGDYAFRIGDYVTWLLSVRGLCVRLSFGMRVEY